MASLPQASPNNQQHSSYYEQDGSDSASLYSRYHMQPAPLLDQSHLRPGKEAALLSHERTIELYRENAKKTTDPDLQFEFATFMLDAGMTLTDEKLKEGVLKDATDLFKRLADRGHPNAQYTLGDCYANGVGTVRGKQYFDRAQPLFVLAAKHGHPDASYRAGTCFEHGWGCRKDNGKAVQFYKKAAASLHAGAMYRLGVAELNGNLGLNRRPKEGVKWLKRSAEHATEEFPHALHELALLHDRGIENVLFVDHEYSAELFARAAELGYAPSAVKLGENYEYGKNGCPVDPALSIHYYNIAAQQNHVDAVFSLAAWYLVGSPGVLPQSETEAFLWTKKAAELGLVKAMYSLGYFYETGMGTEVDLGKAMVQYRQAAEKGDKRAQKRLLATNRTGHVALDRRVEIEALKEEKMLKRGEGKSAKDDSCIIM